MERRLKLYVFFREAGFYPIECLNDDEAKAQAEGNPGTIKVEDGKGRVVWRRQ